MIVNIPEQIIEKLELNLIETENLKDDNLTIIKKSICFCSFAMADLRSFITSTNFDNVKDEIYFFKEIKPKVYAKFLYYSKLLQIECTKPFSTTGYQIEFYQKIQECLYSFFSENETVYKYYRMKQCHLDEVYFSRSYIDIPQSSKDLHFLIDREFSTCHDFTWANIIAHEMLINYINTELNKLDSLEGSSNKKDFVLPWTDKSISIVELGYAIRESGAIKNGEADIKEIMKAFEIIFEIDLKNFYRTYLEIRNRKTDKTRFLDKLKQALINRMNDSDK